MINRKTYLNFKCIIHVVFFCFLLLLTPTQLWAESVPEGFGDLFEKEKKLVEFEDTDGVFHSIEMNVNYNSVQLDSKKSEEKVRKAFLISNVKKSLVDKIISDLYDGILNDERCVGDINSCVIHPETYALAYDYYSNKVYFWINPKYIDSNYSSNDVNYANAYNKNPAIINHFNGYTRLDQDGSNYSLNDRVVMGLPYGNVSSEFNYQQSDNDFDVDELLYNLEFSNYKTQIGYTNNRKVFNATDFLVNDVNNGEWALDFGTSNNLVLNGQKSIQKIFFFAPQNGVLTVYRDDRILLQKNVSQGQGFITNEDLPSGRYDVRLVIRSGNQVVSEQTQSIYNTTNDSLLIGGYDYHLTAGIYGHSNSDLLDSLDVYEPDDSSVNQIDADVTGEAFLRSLVAYRFNNEITLGAGLSGSSVGSYLNLGGNIYLPYDARLTATSYLYNDGSLQFESSLGLHNWSASYEHFSTSDDQEVGQLAKYMFNESNYEKYSLSTNFQLGRSRFGYLTYNYIKQDSTRSYSGYTSSYLSGGMSFNTILNSNIDINASYDFGDSPRDKLSASIVWSIPLSNFITGKATVRSTENGLTQLSTSLETKDLVNSDDIYLTAQASQTYSSTSPNTYSGLTASGSMRKDGFSGSAYAYADTTGERSINANISSTQVITKNNAYVTRYNSDSYIAVDSDSHIRFDEDSSSRGLLVVNGNGRQEKRETLYKDTTILPLQSYKSYNTYLDTESVDLYNLGDKSGKAFSLPGTVVEIKPKLTRVITFISGFKDIFENSVSDINCDGDGCVSVDEVADGVYKISVREGENFTLNRNKFVCMIPPVDDAKLFNFGENYCFPNIAKLSSSIFELDGEDKRVYFIGEFSTNETKGIIDRQIKSLNDDNFKFIKKEIGRNSYVYAISEKNYSVTAKAESLFNNMSKYANESPVMFKNYALQR